MSRIVHLTTCVPLICIELDSFRDVASGRERRSATYPQQLKAYSLGLRPDFSNTSPSALSALPYPHTLAEGSGFPFPSVLEGGEMGELALTPAQMATNLETRLRTARMEDAR